MVPDLPHPVIKMASRTFYPFPVSSRDSSNLLKAPVRMNFSKFFGRKRFGLYLISVERDLKSSEFRSLTVDS